MCLDIARRRLQRHATQRVPSLLTKTLGDIVKSVGLEVDDRPTRFLLNNAHHAIHPLLLRSLQLLACSQVAIDSESVAVLVGEHLRSRDVH